MEYFMLTRSKKIFFAVFTILLLFALLSISEVTLRVMYPDSLPKFVEEVSYDQITWYKINRSYLKKYFASTDPLIPEFKPSLFRKEKQKNSIRIFCLGESSMFGVPYQMTANIPGILRAQLRHAYPEKEIEVINLGASAINTNVIRDFSPLLLQFQPDLILIYTGHNEFYGPDGIGASWLEKQFPFLTQWKYHFRDLAIINLLGTFFAGKPSPESLHNTNMMKQVSQEATVQLHSAEAEKIFAHFEKNLTAIINEFQSHNIPVIISDVTSNLTFAPFEYDTILAQQSTALQAGNSTEKLLSFTAQHPEDSYSRFLLATAYAHVGKYDSAKIFFSEARDRDFLKFRAPKEINSIIQKSAQQTHIPFFSTDSIFSINSPHGISDTSLFWEHLHPKVNGYYLIANGFLSEIQKLNIFPRSTVQMLPCNLDSLHICWFDLAFGDRTITNLTTKWPFKNFTVSTQYFPTAPEPLQHIVEETFRMEKVWDEACYESAQIFWKMNNVQAAMITYRAIIDEYPYNFYAHYLLANALSQTGKIQESAKHYQISMQSNPLYPYAKAEFGLLQINNGKFDAAILLLTNALQISQQEGLAPLRSTIYYGLGTAYANKRMFKEALQYVEKSLQAAPNNHDAFLLKQKLLPFSNH